MVWIYNWEDGENLGWIVEAFNLSTKTWCCRAVQVDWTSSAQTWFSLVMSIVWAQNAQNIVSIYIPLILRDRWQDCRLDCVVVDIGVNKAREGVNEWVIWIPAVADNYTFRFLYIPHSISVFPHTDSEIWHITELLSFLTQTAACIRRSLRSELLAFLGPRRDCRSRLGAL